MTHMMFLCNSCKQCTPDVHVEQETLTKLAVRRGVSLAWLCFTSLVTVAAHVLLTCMGSRRRHVARATPVPTPLDLHFACHACHAPSTLPCHLHTTSLPVSPALFPSCRLSSRSAFACRTNIRHTPSSLPFSPFPPLPCRPHLPCPSPLPPLPPSPFQAEFQERVACAGSAGEPTTLRNTLLASVDLRPGSTGPTPPLDSNKKAYLLAIATAETCRASAGRQGGGSGVGTNPLAVVLGYLQVGVRKGGGEGGECFEIIRVVLSELGRTRLRWCWATCRCGGGRGEGVGFLGRQGGAFGAGTHPLAVVLGYLQVCGGRKGSMVVKGI